MQTITRTQLRGYGLSDYLINVLTRELKPIKIEKNFHHFSLSEIIASARAYQRYKSVKLKTIQRLATLLQTLEECQDNLIIGAFGTSTNKELSELAQRACQTLSKTIKILSNDKAEVASIKGKKYGRRKTIRKIV